VATQIEKNPEFPGALAQNSRQSMIINQQLFMLKTTIANLRNAYNGNDVEWTDQGEFFFD
jgi:glypican 4 (K-glypican)